MLTLAGREADIVGVNPNLKAGVIGPDAVLDALAPSVDQKLEWVRQAAGDRFDDIELNVLSFIQDITDDSAGAAGVIAEMFGVSADEVLDVPAVLIGSIPELTERLQARRERWGFSYYVFQADAVDKMAPLVAELTGH